MPDDVGVAPDAGNATDPTVATSEPEPAQVGGQRLKRSLVAARRRRGMSASQRQMVGGAEPALQVDDTHAFADILAALRRYYGQLELYAKDIAAKSAATASASASAGRGAGAASGAAAATTTASSSLRGAYEQFVALAMLVRAGFVPDSAALDPLPGTAAPVLVPARNHVTLFLGSMAARGGDHPESVRRARYVVSSAPTAYAAEHARLLAALSRLASRKPGSGGSILGGAASAAAIARLDALAGWGAPSALVHLDALFSDALATVQARLGGRAVWLSADAGPRTDLVLRVLTLFALVHNAEVARLLASAPGRSAWLSGATPSPLVLTVDNRDKLVDAVFVIAAKDK